MKAVLILGFLCIVVTVVAAKKAEKDYNNEETYHSWSEGKDQVKKYVKDHKSHHHHHDKKYKDSYYPEEKKYEHKKTKHVAKSAPHEIPQHEAELQADIKTNKKHLKERQFKDEKADLHLQDLTHEETLNHAHGDHDAKSPHEHQRGQHKTSHHFTNHKVSKEEEKSVEEKKLFADQNSKKELPEKTHPVLEDSFEALNKDVNGQDKLKEQEKKSKKHSKQKKAFDKSKDKKQKKNKKDKKEKKEKKSKKEKKHW